MTLTRKGITLIATAAMFLVMCLAVLVPAQPAHALAKIKCALTTGSAYADPIVHHNQAIPVGHKHQFFGNANLLTLANPDAANYSDMVSKPDNCINKGDSAGYWVPVLTYTATGATVPIHAFTAYYRSFNHLDFGPGAPIPADTRLVSHNYAWSCGQFSGTGPVLTLPNCTSQNGTPGRELTLHITFPSCWDGVLPNHQSTDVGDTEDTAHYAFTVGGKCPTGFPHEMVELRETVTYSYTGPGTDITLSSDASDNTTQGRSAHGDYWQTWNPTSFQQMVTDCVNNKALFNKTVCGG